MSASLNLPIVRTPLLEHFEILGLYGYKNLSLSCETNVKIISAENGSGKTTLLNAMYAILTGKLGPLIALNFREIVLKISGAPEIRVTRDELFPESDEAFAKALRTSPQGREFLTYGATPDEIREALLLYAAHEDYRKSSGYKKIYTASPLDHDDMQVRLDRLSPMVSGTAIIVQLQEKIKSAFKSTTVLYLPTYRRIEADLPEFSRRTSRQRQIPEFANQNEWDTDRLIFFGMRDVENRLKDVTDDIRRGTFEAYAKISARTLDEMIGTQPIPKLDPESINLETLRLVLARLGKSESESEKRIADLISSNRINDGEFSPLRSFLGQLAEIYQEKRDSEQSIEEFLAVVNHYWKRSSDQKELRFDKLKVEVEARSAAIDRKLPLAALSSGEKQILSVFARLYLDWGKKYLILIDEPELSLSLEWQRSFLPDVLRTPTCEQLIAITHSPFVFENELDAYAGSLESSVTRTNNV